MDSARSRGKLVVETCFQASWRASRSQNGSESDPERVYNSFVKNVAAFANTQYGGKQFDIACVTLVPGPFSASKLTKTDVSGGILSFARCVGRAGCIKFQFGPCDMLQFMSDSIPHRWREIPRRMKPSKAKRKVPMFSDSL